MAGDKKLGDLTVLLVGDDVVTTKLEATLQTLGPDVERASAALATEVMQMAAPDLVVVSPTASAECGRAVIDALGNCDGAPIRVFLICNASRATELGFVDADGIAVVDPRLGANRVAQLAEEVLRLDNDNAGRKRMAELVAAAHGRKATAVAPKASATASAFKAPAAAATASSAKAAPVHEGTRPRFRSPTALGTPAATASKAAEVPSPMGAKAAVPAAAFRAPNKPVAAIPKLSDVAQPVRGSTQSGGQPNARLQTPAAAFSVSTPQTSSAHRQTPPAVGSTAAAQRSRSLAPAPQAPTPLSALLANGNAPAARVNAGPLSEQRAPAVAMSPQPTAPAPQASAVAMRINTTKDWATPDDSATEASLSLNEEATVVDFTVSQRAELERTHTELGAVDAVESAPKRASSDGIETHLPALARSVEEASVVMPTVGMQRLAFAATFDAEPSAIGATAIAEDFSNDVFAHSPMPQGSPSMPVELAATLESTQHHAYGAGGVIEQDALESLPSLPQKPPSQIAQQLQARMVQFSKLAAHLMAVGHDSGKRTLAATNRWLRQSMVRAEHIHIGKLRFPYLVASAGAAVILLAVLWISVGGVQPPQTRALSSMEIAGTVRVAETKVGAAPPQHAVTASTDDIAEDAADRDLEPRDNHNHRSTISDATQALLNEARDLIREGDGRLRDRRFGMAEAAYLMALRKIPRYPLALEGLTRVHLARKDGKEAVRWAAKLVKRQPIRSSNFLLLGDAYALRGNTSAAKNAWKRAAKAGNKVAANRLKSHK